MYNFFNLNEGPVELIPMYGTVHLISLLVTIILITMLFVFKKKVKVLANDQNFMRSIAWIFLAEQTFYWILIWLYRYEPMSERFPGHLCSTLSIILPILIITEKYNWFRFFGYWAISAGFISMVNPSYGHVEVGSYSFITYHIRHYFLLLMPIFVQIGRGSRHNYKEFLTAVGVLAGYAFLIFLLDWGTGANYMHLGPNNTLEVPFIPKNLSVWPWTYPSFSIVGIILTHIAFLCFKLMERATVAETE